MLQLRNVSRRLDSMPRQLLDNISMQIVAGRRVGLVGPSGSGKSSLLRAMAMLDPIDDGEIWFQGKPIRQSDVPEYRRQVVYLSQHPTLVEGTVRRNLQAPFRFKSAKTKYDESRVLGLLDQIQKPPSILEQDGAKLSGGERQLVALVRAVQLDPVVLLLDEPTASLDEDLVALVESMLRGWQSDEESRCLVWVSHDRLQVDRMADQIVRLDEGRLDRAD